jgi:hypothetical protein
LTADQSGEQGKKRDKTTTPHEFIIAIGPENCLKERTGPEAC